MATCSRCLDGRHARCEDRSSCSCNVCSSARRTAAKAVKLPRPAPVQKREPRPRRSTGVGRPPLLTKEQQAEVRAYVLAGNSMNRAAAHFEISRRTVKRCMLDDFKNEQYAHGGDHPPIRLDEAAEAARLRLEGQSWVDIAERLSHDRTALRKAVQQAVLEGRLTLVAA